MKRKYTQEQVEEHLRGRIYCNKDDSNIFIKRKGWGAWTMNFGNKWTWAIMGAELLATGLVLWLVL